MAKCQLWQNKAKESIGLIECRSDGGRAPASPARLIDVVDPVAYAASALVIATACLIAVSVPTLRAARIDPIATLRKD